MICTIFIVTGNLKESDFHVQVLDRTSWMWLFQWFCIICTEVYRTPQHHSLKWASHDLFLPVGPVGYIWANGRADRWRSSNQQPLHSTVHDDTPHQYSFLYFGGCAENMAENLKGNSCWLHMTLYSIIGLFTISSRLHLSVKSLKTSNMHTSLSWHNTNESWGIEYHSDSRKRSLWSEAVKCFLFC